MGSVDSNRPLFLFEADLDDVEVHDFATGRASLFARRAPGKVTANQDSVAVIPFGRDRGVLAVADGVGGLSAGERASSLVLRSIAQAVASIRNQKNGTLRSAILDGIEAANEEILSSEGIGGTTLAAIEFSGNTVRPYHVGDSTVLVTGQRGRVKALTVPHSPVGYAVESGYLDEWDAMMHADRHLVDNIVGTESMRIEIGPEVSLAKRDTVLLASDGLTDNLFLAEIVESIRRGDLRKSTRALVESCHERMTTLEPDQPSKPDDLSLIAFRLR